MVCHLAVAGATILPNVGGWVGSLAVRNNYNTWYMTLNKPNWTPPKYVFAPVWTSLYCGMGYASYLVWKNGGGFDGEAALPLIAYGTQLALNWAWTPLFFSCHSLKWSLVDIGLLTASAGYCAVSFYKIDKTAGLLMLPYLAWLGLASSLNYYIYKNNNELESKKQ
ncbi:translocator protein [Rhodnius prolixus]|uniref:Peripheral-type benzodiazepine receptor n=2 Tax=Rhodnius TaxID=13248 RepID=T1I353_RHOPR